MNDGFPNPLLVAVFFIHLPSAIPCLNHEGLFEKGAKQKEYYFGVKYTLFLDQPIHIVMISPRYIP